LEAFSPGPKQCFSSAKSLVGLSVLDAKGVTHTKVFGLEIPPYPFFSPGAECLIHFARIRWSILHSVYAPKKSVAYVSDHNAKTIFPVGEGYSPNAIKIFPSEDRPAADSAIFLTRSLGRITRRTKEYLDFKMLADELYLAYWCADSFAPTRTYISEPMLKVLWGTLPFSEYPSLCDLSFLNVRLGYFCYYYLFLPIGTLVAHAVIHVIISTWIYSSPVVLREIT